MGAPSRRVWSAVALVALLSSGGCAKGWDVLSGKRFRSDPFSEPFRSVDATAVVTQPETLDPDERAEAMRRLPDAKDAAPDAALKTLEESATRDPHGVCRMAAIDGLAKVETPGAESALLKAYAAADKETAGVHDKSAGTVLAAALREPGGSALAPEQVTQIQIRALEALARMRSTQGLEVILKAARAPEVKPSKGERDKFDMPGVGEASPVLAQSDLRLAALRSLAHYKGEPKAVELLIATLKTDRDVAVKGRAHATLQAITGQTLPPDAAAWEQWRASGAVPGSGPGLMERVGNLFE